MILSRDQILSVNDRKTEVVTVPEVAMLSSASCLVSSETHTSMITEVDAKEKLCIDLKPARQTGGVLRCR